MTFKHEIFYKWSFNLTFFIFNIAIFLLLPFYPLISFIFLIFTLSLFSFYISNFYRLFLHFLGLFILVVVSSSKSFYNELDMDLTAYIMVNDYLKISDFFGIFNNYFSTEPGWNIVYWVLNKVGFDIKGIYVGIANYIVCCFMFFLWFEIHALKLFDKKFYSLVTATSLLFISISFFAILQRQSIACIFILFALSNFNNLKKFTLYSFLAILFHTTSILFILIYYFLMKNKINIINWFWICFFVIFIKFVFPFLINLLSGIDIFSLKAAYYKDDVGFGFFSFRLFVFVFICLVSLIFIKGSYFQKTQYKNVFIFSLLCYVLTIGINLLPERLNYFNVYLIGLYLALIYLPRKSELLIVLNIFFGIVFYVERSLLNSYSSDSFWFRYPEYSASPFYYLQYIFN